MWFPPFEAAGVGVEPVGSEEQVHGERYGGEGAQIDQVVFPSLGDEEFFCFYMVSAGKRAVHLDDVPRLGGADVFGGAEKEKIAGRMAELYLEGVVGTVDGSDHAAHEDVCSIECLKIFQDISLVGVMVVVLKTIVHHE